MHAKVSTFNSAWTDRSFSEFRTIINLFRFYTNSACPFGMIMDLDVPFPGGIYDLCMPCFAELHAMDSLSFSLFLHAALL